MPLPVTMIAAGLMALLYAHLAFRVIAVRRRLQVAFGDGGEKELIRIARGHANAGEYIPICLILLGLLESAGAPLWLVAIGAAAMLAGRFLHGLYFAHPGLLPSSMRVLGMQLTIAPMIFVAVGLIGHGVIDLVL
ncbi:MAG: MAPEG family protein [Pseudomonadota bacterium]